jgi:hypothetical protein
MIASADARRTFVMDNVVSGHYARQCLAFIAAAEARATTKFSMLGGYEDVQKRLKCGLFTKNRNDLRIVNKNYTREIAEALANHKNDLKSTKSAAAMLRYAEQVRRRISIIGERYDNAMERIYQEDKTSGYRQQAHAVLHCVRWLCHFWLFSVGALLSGPTYDTHVVGCHVKVTGDMDHLVPLGTYVHVDKGKVYSNERFLAEYLDGIDADDEKSVAINSELGRYEIGHIDRFIYNNLPDKFSAIVWGRNYADVYGRDDDEIDDDASYPDGFDQLFYDIVILGSSGVYHYDEWDQLYSPLKSHIVDRA